LDDHGDLLDARVASDEQWRLPLPDSIPILMKKALILQEDEYFQIHPGVNPISILRAVYQNYQADKIISGGSTLTMQLVRIALGNQKRSMTQKMYETLLAIKLDLLYTKEEILHLYLSHAPFGGNLVGASSASWRYYGRGLHQCSVAELATLAVLPNNPSHIYPGKANPKLLQKRNRLLQKMQKRDLISQEESALFQAESIPQSWHPIPHDAYHLLHHTSAFQPQNHRQNSHINKRLQLAANQIVKNEIDILEKNNIYNACILVQEIPTGNVIAYVGNAQPQAQKGRNRHVDMIRAPRSPGSILKPILYARAMEKGFILPTEILPDHPIYHQGFSPKNFNHRYRGSVRANQALASSLNVPFVHLLQKYGYQQFHQDLDDLGLHLDHDADHYGMSIILGGIETNLWDLVHMYRNIAHNYNQVDHIHPDSVFLHPGAVMHMLKAMTTVRRPEDMEHWARFEGSRQVAWKTGTSYGLRDAWAIGITDHHVVGVWVGNADGTGQPDIIGGKIAAPILFDYIEELNDGDVQIISIGNPEPICVQSGKKPGPYCKDTALITIPTEWTNTATCHYHHELFLDKNKQYQVTKDCYPWDQMRRDTHFTMPSIMAKYSDSYSEEIPELHPNCGGTASMEVITLIYPSRNAKIILPIEQDGEPGEVIFHASHQNPGTPIFWYINESFIGKTEGEHKIGSHVIKGQHTLTLVDKTGHIIQSNFEIL